MNVLWQRRHSLERGEWGRWTEERGGDGDLGVALWVASILANTRFSHVFIVIFAITGHFLKVDYH